jgi:molecular chaperone DnaK
MAREAEEHAAEDKARREEIEAKNQLDALVYSVEKMLRENGDKISGADRGNVENAIADAKKALESNDRQQMDRAREQLTQASHQLAEQMYRSAQPQPAAQAADPKPGASAGQRAQPGSQTGGSDAVDAEYEDIDERKAS